VSGGAVGRIWRLSLGTDRFAVKELFGDASEESARGEAALVGHVRAAGIRVPEALAGTDGRYVVRLPATSGGSSLRLSRWIDASPVGTATGTVAGQAGDLLGRLHARPLPPYGDVDSWFDTTPDPAAWDQLTDAALAGRAPWAATLASHATLISELSAIVTPAPPDEMITCHRDLHPDNVLIDGSGQLVLFDWDDAGPACPDRELARMLADWHVHDGTPDAGAVRSTVSSYAAAGGEAAIRDEQSFSMYIACTLNFLHTQASHALDAGITAEHRRHAQAEATETLTRLPAPDVITRLTRLGAR
jgi:Ser/Thr protein kinase RdoA (MazF antagonist)